MHVGPVFLNLDTLNSWWKNFRGYTCVPLFPEAPVLKAFVVLMEICTCCRLLKGAGSQAW